MTQIFTIDNGNTNPNVAFFENGEISEILLKDAFMARYEAAPPLKAKAVMADVGHNHVFDGLFGKGLVKLGDLRKPENFLNMPVHYAMTLGEDRLALAYYFYETMRPQLPALIVDSGTFATVDVVTDAGFMGGYIFPGIRRFYQIYGDSARLPDLSQTSFNLGDDNTALPQTTNDAILKAGEIYWRGIFSQLKTGLNFAFKTVVLTGGDALTLKPLLSSVFCNTKIIADSRLIHYSLYAVYQKLANTGQI